MRSFLSEIRKKQEIIYKIQELRVEGKIGVERISYSVRNFFNSKQNLKKRKPETRNKETLKQNF
jgi:hypothetical protein